MAKVKVFNGEDAAWMEQSDPRPLGYKIHHPGNDEELQLFEIKLEPGATIDVHAHDESEIIYVLEGSLALGAQHVGRGSSVAIPGRTLYGFTAGPEGVRFLNFRARQDTTFYTKEAFMAARGPRQ
jgi:quercetin dioxygenase-like cupin family protein